MSGKLTELWRRLTRPRPDEPIEPAASEMMPAGPFKELVREGATRVLVPRGWQARGRRLRWQRRVNDWATAVVELRSLKGGGVALRWGLRLAFVPPLRIMSRVGDLGVEASPLHLSYDPTDYVRSTRGWAISRFSTAEQVVSQATDLATKGDEACRAMMACTGSVTELIRCFEEKEARPALRFKFVHYPHEVLAYCVTLGWVNREEEALEHLGELIERGSLSEERAERLVEEVRSGWRRGGPA